MICSPRIPTRFRRISRFFAFVLAIPVLARVALLPSDSDLQNRGSRQQPRSSSVKPLSFDVMEKSINELQAAMNARAHPAGALRAQMKLP